MQRWMKVTLGVGVGLVVLAAGAVFTGLQLADSRKQRKVDVAPAPVAYVSDAASLERGRYLFMSRGCAECHGADGTGRVFAEDGQDLKLKAPNITTGPGSMVTAYTPVDWVRAIRHGVAPGGRVLQVMPSEDYNRFTDADLAAVVAYARSLPPAKGEPAIVQLPLPARVLYGFGAIPDAFDRIDHRLPPAQPIPAGVTAQHGAYVANMCLGCHGAQLTGGPIPGAPPDWPAAANLRPGPTSAMVRYPDADTFMAMFRSGKRPDGSAIPVMPFESLKHMNDTDVRALHLYLKGLPAATRS